jgi:hypothetical protein
MSIKSKSEQEIIRQGGKIMGEILYTLYTKCVPGISTLELDMIAEKMILKADGRPVFKGYRVPSIKTSFPDTILYLELSLDVTYLVTIEDDPCQFPLVDSRTRVLFPERDFTVPLASAEA